MLFALALLVIGAQSCSTPTYHPTPSERPDTDTTTTEPDTDTDTSTGDEGTETETGSRTLATGEYVLEVVGVEELSGCGIRPADIMGATALAPVAVRGERAVAYLDPVLMRGELVDGVLSVEGSVLARIESDTDTDTDTDADTDTDTAPPDSGRPGRTIVVGSAWIEAEVLSSTSAEGLFGYDDGSCVYVLDVTLDRDDDTDTDTDTDTTDCGEETDCG